MMGNYNISSYVPCICFHGDYQSKYNFVETPRKFIIELTDRKLCDDK